jgi:hypothetical protein
MNKSTSEIDGVKLISHKQLLRRENVSEARRKSRLLNKRSCLNSFFRITASNALEAYRAEKCLQTLFPSQDQHKISDNQFRLEKQRSVE